MTWKMKFEVFALLPLLLFHHLEASTLRKTNLSYSISLRSTVEDGYERTTLSGGNSYRLFLLILLYYLLYDKRIARLIDLIQQRYSIN